MMLYLIGEPGVGKTTAMNRVLDRCSVGPPYRLGRQFYAEPIDGPKGPGWHLGRRRESFGGTDALGMAAITAACEWVRTVPDDQVLLGEGQRLGVARFIDTAMQRHSILLIWLDGPIQAQAWREARGSHQSSTFVKGAATRASRLYDKARTCRTPNLATWRVPAGPEAPQQIAALWDAFC